jgi:hypothetical protein
MRDFMGTSISGCLSLVGQLPSGPEVTAVTGVTAVSRAGIVPAAPVTNREVWTGVVRTAPVSGPAAFNARQH